MPAYLVSLLKAYWGDAATADNDYCFDYLPRLTGAHGTYQTVAAQLDGDCKGYLLFGENPAVGSANAKMQRLGMAELEWLVVRDFSLIESATWWKDGPEILSGEKRTEDIGTEVFFFPAAAHTEKDGSFTNTNRMLQWHHAAIEPAGDARSDLWFMYHLGRLVRERLSESTEARDRPVQQLTWDYPTSGRLDEPSAEAVLAEINGFDGDGRPLSAYTELKDDGTTRCGCWIYCGVNADGVNQAARRKPAAEQNWLGPEWGWVWPANRRILYNRASADPSGQPWSQDKRLVWWDDSAGKWTGDDVPDFVPDKRPDYQPPEGSTGPDALSGTEPFIMQADGRGWLYAPSGVVDGPDAGPLRAAGLPDPKSPLPQSLPQPGTGDHAAPREPLSPRPGRAGRRGCLPVRRDDLPPHRALHGRRDDPVDAVPERAATGVLLRDLAPAGRAASAGTWRLGHDRHGSKRHRSAGPGHRPHPAAAGGRPHHPPDRAAVPLGPQRPEPGRRGQRAHGGLDGPDRPHPGGQGADR